MKTVWVKAHGGSNPSSCAKKTETAKADLRLFSETRVERFAELTGVRATSEKVDEKAKGRGQVREEALAKAKIPKCQKDGDGKG